MKGARSCQRLPFDAIDILVIKGDGKNFSGTGMDTNVGPPHDPAHGGGSQTRRGRHRRAQHFDESHGNAAGYRPGQRHDAARSTASTGVATYTNSVTSGIFGMQRVNAHHHGDDRRAGGCATLLRRARYPGDVGLYQHTSKLRQLWVSPNLRQTVEESAHLRLVREVALQFDEEGISESVEMPEK